MERTGGVRGFVAWLERRRWVDTPRKAEWLAWGTGIVVFIESNLTLLVAGSVSRPLFDRFRISRERLAYLIDATSAPVCILIPLNAWGAFNLGLLGSTALEDPLGTFILAIPLNFYAILAVALAAASIAFRWNFGPMAKAEARTVAGSCSGPMPRPWWTPRCSAAPLAIPARQPGVHAGAHRRDGGCRAHWAVPHRRRRPHRRLRLDLGAVGGAGRPGQRLAAWPCSASGDGWTS
jgi:Na+/H+ antiporter NhaC